MKNATPCALNMLPLAPKKLPCALKYAARRAENTALWFKYAARRAEYIALCVKYAARCAENATLWLINAIKCTKILPRAVTNAAKRVFSSPQHVHKRGIHPITRTGCTQFFSSCMTVPGANLTSYSLSPRQGVPASLTLTAHGVFSSNISTRVCKSAHTLAMSAEGLGLP